MDLGRDILGKHECLSELVTAIVTEQDRRAADMILAQPIKCGSRSVIQSVSEDE